MGGMDTKETSDNWEGLSTTVSAPTKFTTSSPKPQTRDTTRLKVSKRNTLRGVKPYVDSIFKPSYSYKSEKWREEILFKTAAAAEAYYSNSWGLPASATGTNQKDKVTEPHYDFQDGYEDVETEDDPDDKQPKNVSSLDLLF
jgi:hypothetical protein